jgi:CheY-like chemotaxis protein
MCIIDDASDGREAIIICSKLLLGGIIMDFAVSGINGIEATKHIHKNNPKKK